MTDTHYTVEEKDKGKRLDKVLTQVIPEKSRSQIQEWIANQFVTVNGEFIKSNYKCKVADQIHWKEPEVQPLEIEPENIPLDIVFEDEAVIVINKPRGMVVHPSAGHRTGTLVHALLYHCDDLSGINGVERPGIVHRLDKDTSGLLVVAKTDVAHQYLVEQLANQQMKRIYEAIVHGTIEHETGLIDAPIARDPKDRQKMGIVSGGKKAITHFRVVKRYPEYTYVHCQLETGRTHQIRVHMRYIDHPIVGDPKYGPRKTLDLGGQALHAREIGFYHPSTKKWIEFECDAPTYFQNVLINIADKY